jgi:hypothetical protein
MRKVHSIEPFPTDIDRNYFGAWLSGFTDGEGCFAMKEYARPPTYVFVANIYFEITLRSDEISVIRLIRSFFDCGRIYTDNSAQRRNENAKPTISFRMNKSNDLVTKLIPHFERYPLLAKKKRDFLIWKEGVILRHEIMGRPRKARIGRFNGGVSQWEPDEKARFTLIVNTLLEQRKFNSENIELPPFRTLDKTPLFSQVEVNGTLADEEPPVA